MLYVLIPGVVKTAMNWLGDCAIPMSLFMIGATIGRLFRREFWDDAIRVTIASCLVRLVLHAAIILATAKFLPLPVELQKVLVVQAGMPSTT